MELGRLQSCLHEPSMAVSHTAVHVNLQAIQQVIYVIPVVNQRKLYIPEKGLCVWHEDMLVRAYVQGAYTGLAG